MQAVSWTNADTGQRPTPAPTPLSPPTSRLLINDNLPINWSGSGTYHYVTPSTTPTWFMFRAINTSICVLQAWVISMLSCATWWQQLEDRGGSSSPSKTMVIFTSQKPGWSREIAFTAPLSWFQAHQTPRRGVSHFGAGGVLAPSPRAHTDTWGVTTVYGLPAQTFT